MPRGQRLAPRRPPAETIKPDSLAELAGDLDATAAYVRRISQRMQVPAIALLWLLDGFALRADLLAYPRGKPLSPPAAGTGEPREPLTAAAGDTQEEPA